MRYLVDDFPPETPHPSEYEDRVERPDPEDEAPPVLVPWVGAPPVGVSPDEPF